jgi:hypothetical protein
MKSLLLAVVLGMSLTAPPAAGQTPAAGDSLLQRLVGRWRMSGTVRGIPAEYDLDAVPVLRGQFVRLHMVDRSQAPQYEAMVFLGVDSATSRLVAHWLDVFGAGYSVTLGMGDRPQGATLAFAFAYPDGAFRDTFTYDHTTDTWRFLLENGDGKGGWRTFADYAVRRDDGR